MSIAHGNPIDQQKERIMKKQKLVFLSTCAAVLSLTACGNKAESNVVETATPAPTATASPAPTATPVPENHSIDTAIDTYKDENNIDINPDDIGTDIPDTSILYDWLYNNGVTKESVQNDRDSGCKNPYLEGYLEYLDSLVDKQIAEDNAGQDESSAKGDGLGGTEIIGGDEFILDSDGGGTVNGFYYDADSIAAIRKAAEKQEAKRAENEALIDQMHKDGEKIQKDLNDPQWRQDTLNEILGNN